jgi:hypothetical protein
VAATTICRSFAAAGAPTPPDTGSAATKAIRGTTQPAQILAFSHFRQPLANAEAGRCRTLLTNALVRAGADRAAFCAESEAHESRAVWLGYLDIGSRGMARQRTLRRPRGSRETHAVRCPVAWKAAATAVAYGPLLGQTAVTSSAAARRSRDVEWSECDEQRIGWGALVTSGITWHMDERGDIWPTPHGDTYHRLGDGKT